MFRPDGLAHTSRKRAEPREIKETSKNRLSRRNRGAEARSRRGLCTSGCYSPALVLERAGCSQRTAKAAPANGVRRHPRLFSLFSPALRAPSAAEGVRVLSARARPIGHHLEAAASVVEVHSKDILGKARSPSKVPPDHPPRYTCTARAAPLRPRPRARWPSPRCRTAA